MAQGLTYALGSQGSKETRMPQESAHTADAVHCSNLCLGFESASNRENDPPDDMEAVLKNVEECASICARLE